MDVNFNFFSWLWAKLKPTKIISWQTLFLVSIGLYFCAFFSYMLAKNYHNPTIDFNNYRQIFSFCSWIFFLIAIIGLFTQNPLMIKGFSLNPWVMGILLSVFLFALLKDVVKLNTINAGSISLIICPPICGLIATLHLLRENGKFKLPDATVRQKIIILLLSHLMISCWLEFYTLIQTWPKYQLNRPTEEFRKSAFVIKIQVK